MSKIAIISSIPSEEDFLPFHYKIQNIAKDKHGVDIDLLKNGEFCHFISHKNEIEIYYKNIPFFVNEYSLVFCRMAIKASHAGDYYVLREFEKFNIPIINPPKSLIEAKDKFNTLQILQKKGLPVTPTAIVRTRENISFSLKLIGKPPYIIKNCFGSGGSGVFIANNISQVYSIFDYVWRVDRNEIWLIQPYMGFIPASDIRAICLNYKFWRAMQRNAKETTEFRANIKTGSSSVPIELTSEEKDLVEKASKALGLPLAALDFLRTPKGPFILEINGTPGFDGISKAYESVNINIMEELVKFLLDMSKK